ncbi:MAG: hypothetical protein CMH11_03280 [Maritimibacter sp.]|nr:hypothetical protein [Maritimibacter sp.]
MQGEDSVCELGSCGVLAIVASELERASDVCQMLQHLIAALLEKSSHPDLIAEFHMLQELDRLQQTVSDLANVASFLSNTQPDNPLNSNDLASKIILRSLRDRLISGSSVHARSSHRDDNPTDWF